jgi:hypothetical protein
MEKIINLPAASSTDLLAYAGQLFSDLWVLVVIAIGIPVGFMIIVSIIGIFKGRKRYGKII